jgi:alpha-D-ribose 1-methylphosphonate 5-triphosphate synthase subunit PhnI
MGYVAAKGGLRAIRAAEALVRRRRATAASKEVTCDQLVERLPFAVDRVIGESGLWDETVAARAIRQAGGDLIEAAHLVRAHRSTLPRLAYSEPVPADDIEVMRRIVPAFREAPGDQLLGHTSDYTGRILEPEHASLTPPDIDDRPGDDDGDGDDRRHPQRLLDVLRAMDLVVDRRRNDDPEPYDITRLPVRPGSGRAARLATMARAETGALVQLWYRNILGPDQHLHEVTLGEVRHGRLPVTVRHPHIDEPVTIGAVRVTGVEAIEDLNGDSEDRHRFDVGYGMCLGHNERKAIAMANLDIAVDRAAPGDPLEQSVLMTTDGLDAAGFLEHLKLPHYVTFRSMVERKMAMREATPPARSQSRVS